MLETSRDILNLVLAFCILWLTLFLSWGLYYFARILQQIFQMVEDVHQTFVSMGDFFRAVKEKLSSSTAYLALIAKAVEKGIGFVDERRTAARRKKTNAEQADV